jgi:hypothetical protein
MESAEMRTRLPLYKHRPATSGLTSGSESDPLLTALSCPVADTSC